MNWQNKLTKFDHKHLREHEIRTLTDLKETRRLQWELDPDRGACTDCRSIALKLGIE